VSVRDLTPAFRRVLVANRGEIAVRVIRTLRELGIEAVAVYSTADRDELHVRMADTAVCIGPPAAAESYLRIPNVGAAATTTGCDAIHPAYGFLSENPAFVHACEDNGLAFVGPDADVMALLGDKAKAKEAMRAAGVPLVPGTDGVVSLEEARISAEALGYPLVLKAAAGGGGRGLRVVTDPEELADAYAAASAEAVAAFGDGSLYLEQALVPARHVEVQVLADSHGDVLTLGERECSIQRRHQKLVEESPSPALTEITREEMEAAVERACRHVGYVNAGTFEFLLGPDGRPCFIEVNCRLQVEHPVSELTTGIDLVREQLRIAAGERLELSGRAPRRGHAIEIRINAEDPSRAFAPAPGTLSRFRPPLGPGVRVDTASWEGAVISPHYDSLIAKVIVWDETRSAAIARAQRALSEFELEGIPTTRELALDILQSETFASGRYSTSYLAEMEDSLPSLSAA
jgi:acetyl-CoA carboxylase biotin carboxylase subunit